MQRFDRESITNRQAELLSNSKYMYKYIDLEMFYLKMYLSLNMGGFAPVTSFDSLVAQRQVSMRMWYNYRRTDFTYTEARVPRGYIVMK